MNPSSKEQSRIETAQAYKRAVYVARLLSNAALGQIEAAESLKELQAVTEALEHAYEAISQREFYDDDCLESISKTQATAVVLK